ncbi:MAG: hypothetical protein WAT79_11310, partial [Saprospiraceae bacterium]
MNLISRIHSVMKGAKSSAIFVMLFLCTTISSKAQSACDLFINAVVNPSSCHATNGSFVVHATGQSGNPCQRRIEVFNGASLIASGLEEISVQNLPSGDYEIIAYDDCGCSQINNKTLSISGGESTTLIAHMDLGSGYIKTKKGNVCQNGTVKIGVQSLGIQGFTITGPNGFVSTTPEGSTYWQLNQVTTSQSGQYNITFINDQGCTSTTDFQLTVKDLSVDIGASVDICKGQQKNIIAQVSGRSICRGSCNADSSKFLLQWDFNDCNAIDHENQLDYSEFSPDYILDGSCLDIQASNATRQLGSHSCTPSSENIGICFPAFDQCDPIHYNPVNALKFSVHINPEKTSRLTKLSFLEQSPLLWQTTDGNTGINNYNTKFLVKIYKDGNLIYDNVNFSTERNWHLVEIDLSSIPEFTSHEAAFFEFELMGYCVVNQGGTLSGWEIDQLQLFGTCCSDAPIFDDITYAWSNGGDQAFIRVNPTNTTKYFVTITDCAGCQAIDSTVVTVHDAPSVSIEASSTSICLGKIAVLKATGGSSYKWSTGQTTPSITVNPVATTTYSVTATDSNSCVGSASITVTVLP